MNIFAKELATILDSHGKTLSSLYGLRIRDSYDGATFYQIRPHKVTRLLKSLTKDMTATLNADELEALQEWVPLDLAGQEMRRLRAALVAEGVRHLLAGRMSTDQASELGSHTLAMLLDEADRYDVVDRVRGLENTAFSDRYDIPRAATSIVSYPELTPIDDVAETIEPALEPAIEAYEQGDLWLEIARRTLDPNTRLGLAGMSMSLLTHARDLLARTSGNAPDTSQRGEWLMIIETALREASVLRE